MACTDEAIRKGSIPISIRRVKALGASLVCRVLKSKCPVFARTYSYLGSFQISYFSHHDDVRILTQDRAQTGREGQACPQVDGGLVDPFKKVFHWVFKGNDIFFNTIEFIEHGIQACGFPRTGGAAR